MLFEGNGCPKAKQTSQLSQLGLDLAVKNGLHHISIMDNERPKQSLAIGKKPFYTLNPSTTFRISQNLACALISFQSPWRPKLDPDFLVLTQRIKLLLSDNALVFRFNYGV